MDPITRTEYFIRKILHSSPENRMVPPYLFHGNRNVAGNSRRKHFHSMEFFLLFGFLRHAAHIIVRGGFRVRVWRSPLFNNDGISILR